MECCSVRPKGAWPYPYGSNGNTTPSFSGPSTALRGGPVGSRKALSRGFSASGEIADAARGILLTKGGKHEI
jgi:hypothetical protein